MLLLQSRRHYQHHCPLFLVWVLKYYCLKLWRQNSRSTLVQSLFLCVQIKKKRRENVTQLGIFLAVEKERNKKNTNIRFILQIIFKKHLFGIVFSLTYNIIMGNFCYIIFCRVVVFNHTDFPMKYEEWKQNRENLPDATLLFCSWLRQMRMI